MKDKNRLESHFI